MSKKKSLKIATWIDAEHLLLLRYPVPASFGVQGLTAVAQQALHKEAIPADTLVIGFNERGNIATALYVTPAHEQELIKRYCRKKRFGVSEALAGCKGRTLDLTYETLAELLTASPVPTASEG